MGWLRLIRYPSVWKRVRCFTGQTFTQEFFLIRNFNSRYHSKLAPHHLAIGLDSPTRILSQPRGLISYTTMPSSWRDYQVIYEVKLDSLRQRQATKKTTRSRTGCVSCKRRKIKCDEAKAVCKNCVRSGIRCAWPQPRIGDEKAVAVIPSFKTKEERVTISHSLGKRALTSLSEDNTHDKSPEECRSGITPPADGLDFSSLLLPQISWSDPLTIADTPHDPSRKKDNPETDALQMAEGGTPLLKYYLLLPAELDDAYFSRFITGFLPNIAQVNSYNTQELHDLILSTGTHLGALKEVFVACGAGIVALEHKGYRRVAQARHEKALARYTAALRSQEIHGDENWFFVAVQVLQILCLRVTPGGGNATRCAAHFGASYRLVISQLLNSHTVNLTQTVTPLRKAMIENFIFNYSITVMFCDHTRLQGLVPNPFEFFAGANVALAALYSDDSDQQLGYRSMLAFQIAAKCLWLCRLQLPLSQHDRYLHYELSLLAQTLLATFGDEIDRNPASRLKTVLGQVVARALLILLRKMIDPTITANDVQYLVEAMRADIEHCTNRSIIFPIWSLTVGASASVSTNDKAFFRAQLDSLRVLSNLTLIGHVLHHLDALWEISLDDEPFQVLFNTEMMDSICNPSNV